MKTPAPQAESAWPPVSVILPCLNDAGSIGEVLQALETQRYPREKIEIIVVDNGSVDGSPEVVKAHPSVILAHEPERSAYIARNRGIALARGEFLLFMDADEMPCPDWIRCMVETARTSGSPLVGGRIENVVAKPTLGSILLAHTRPSAVRQKWVEAGRLLSGGNMLVAKSAFQRYGNFLPVQSGGDGEFSERANPEKKPLPFCGEAVVTHICDISTWEYLKRAYRIARGHARLWRANGRSLPAIPWRPGFRRAKEIQAALSPRYQASLLRLLGVLWAERWFVFAGQVAGRVFKGGG